MLAFLQSIIDMIIRLKKDYDKNLLDKNPNAGRGFAELLPEKVYTGPQNEVPGMKEILENKTVTTQSLPCGELIGVSCKDSGLSTEFISSKNGGAAISIKDLQTGEVIASHGFQLPINIKTLSTKQLILFSTIITLVLAALTFGVSLAIKKYGMDVFKSILRQLGRVPRVLSNILCNLLSGIFSSSKTIDTHRKKVEQAIEEKKKANEKLYALSGPPKDVASQTDLGFKYFQDLDALEKEHLKLLREIENSKATESEAIENYSRTMKIKASEAFGEIERLQESNENKVETIADLQKVLKTLQEEFELELSHSNVMIQLNEELRVELGAEQIINAEVNAQNQESQDFLKKFYIDLGIQHKMTDQITHLSYNSSLIIARHFATNPAAVMLNMEKINTLEKLYTIIKSLHLQSHQKMVNPITPMESTENRFNQTVNSSTEFVESLQGLEQILSERPETVTSGVNENDGSQGNDTHSEYSFDAECEGGIPPLDTDPESTETLDPLHQTDPNLNFTGKNLSPLNKTFPFNFPAHVVQYNVYRDAMIAFEEQLEENTPLNSPEPATVSNPDETELDTGNDEYFSSFMSRVNGLTHLYEFVKDPTSIDLSKIAPKVKILIQKSLETWRQTKSEIAVETVILAQQEDIDPTEFEDAMKELGL